MSGECDNCGEHILDCRCDINEWVSVEVRLPKINPNTTCSDNVLTYDGVDFHVCCLDFYKASGYRKEDEYYWSEQSTGCGCCSEKILPSHWMPLPFPPKVK